LIERNLRRIGFTREIVKLSDGQACLDWLEAFQQQDTSVMSPCVLLDINMPNKNGVETLSEIKNNKDTHHIPVVMLTTSDNSDEIDQCYKHGCNAYVVKPIAHEEFKEKIRQIGLFLSTISSPSLH
jgi:CheY-like chemotaxis protein